MPPRLANKKWSTALGRKPRIQFSIIGVLVGLACAAILLRQVNLRESWHTLRHLGGPFVLVPIGVFFLNLPLRARRWELIFPPASRPKLTSCLIALGIGNTANFLLPGRVGDLARCALVGSNHSLFESSRTLATLAVEKVLDGLALIGIVLFTIWTFHPPVWVLAIERTAAIIFGSALLLLVLFRYRTRTFIDVARRAFRRMHLSSFEERFERIVSSFADGLSAVSSVQQMLSLLVLTAMIWATEASLIWGLAAALGLAVSLKWAAMASAILGLGLMVPAAPGGLGTYELFGTEAFKIAALPASGALTLTLVIHSWVFVTNVVAGLTLMAVKGLSLAQLRRQLGDSTDLHSGAAGSQLRPSV